MFDRRRGPRLVLPVLTGALLVALLVPARAAEKATGSLGLIPADAAFYGSMLRNKEQLDIIAKSKAWAAIWDMPAVKMGWAELEKQYKSPDSPLARLRAFLEDADNRELVDFLADAGSSEIFSFGGANWAQFSELLGMLNTARTVGPLSTLIEKGGKEAPDPQAQFRSMLRVLAEHPELITIPDFAVGFKVNDTKRAKNQLQRLETIAVGLSNFSETMKGRIKPTPVGDDSFLTVNLDGDMVPWDDLPIKDIEEKEGELAPLVKKLKGLKLTFGLGLKGDYVLFTIGSSIDVVKQLGGDGKRLADRPEMKPVIAASDKRLTAISYTSPALRAQASLSSGDIGSIIQLARQGLTAAGVPEAKRKQIAKDLENLSREMLKEQPEVGAEIAFAYLTERGTESFTYDYTRSKAYDISGPLTLLRHVGGDPIAAAVARQKSSAEDYKTFVKGFKVLYGHAEDIFVEKLDKEQKEVYGQVKKNFFPLIARVDEITGDMLIPALADGQSAIVLDAKWKSKQWFEKMPPLPQAMPLPEIAIVLGVSDAALLRRAAAGYRDVLNDAIAKLREVAPDAKVPPDLKVPNPEKKSVKAGDSEATLYSYPLPPGIGIDAQVLPTVGLSEKVLVIAPSTSMAERILADRPLKVQGGPLAERRPLGAAAYFNFPALVDAASPWVDLGLHVVIVRGGPGGDEDKPPKGQAEEVKKQVQTVKRVLKCFKGYTSATFQQDGVWVTHGESRVQDFDDNP